MAVTESSSPIVQPKILARSPTKAVRNPITVKATINESQPFQILVGGIIARMTFQ